MARSVLELIDRHVGIAGEGRHGIPVPPTTAKEALLLLEEEPWRNSCPYGPSGGRWTCDGGGFAAST